MQSASAQIDMSEFEGKYYIDEYERSIESNEEKIDQWQKLK